VYRSELVVEGGGFLSDGEGTLITAETCVLNPNRNPGWTKARSRGRASRDARCGESDLVAG
jgi:agmatine deiminase